MTPPIRYPAPPWCGAAEPGETVRLWHGCTSVEAANILRFGVDPTRGRWDTDFGQGFYTTTWREQAEFWAWERYYLTPLAPGAAPTFLFPVVIGFQVNRQLLGDLQTLAFAGGDFDAEGFWSLVQHCRKSQLRVKINNHKCTGFAAPIIQNWYDIAVGPVAAFWRQRVAMDDADQVSFHTLNAARLLDDIIQAWHRSNRMSKVLIVEQVDT
jgi:hypothetical protein